MESPSSVAANAGRRVEQVQRGEAPCAALPGRVLVYDVQCRLHILRRQLQQQGPAELEQVRGAFREVVIFGLAVAIDTAQGRIHAAACRNPWTGHAVSGEVCQPVLQRTVPVRSRDFQRQEAQKIHHTEQDVFVALLHGRPQHPYAAPFQSRADAPFHRVEDVPDLGHGADPGHAQRVQRDAAQSLKAKLE